MASIGLLYHLHNRLPEATHQYLQALEMFETSGDRGNAARTLTNLGLIAQAQKQLDKAQTFFEQGLADYESLMDVHGQTTSLINLAKLAIERDDLAQSLNYAKQARLILRDYNFFDQQSRLQELESSLRELGLDL
ncbi:MAG: tetratricopeptide repeat protein [Anaerolineae bacterium]|nr:tetratricopeptide repeat protein [Anaerolineae bacterium]